MRVLPGAAAVLLSGALGLAGCGGGSASSSSSSAAVKTETSAPSAHNDQDASFASAMIGHHTQAITMSKLAATRASASQVKDLASRIDAAQQPEIGSMRRMLANWGEGGNHSGMAMMGHSGDGMATKAQLAELRTAKGAAFDRLFLTLMIAHHRGAIMMAQAEQKAGKNARAVALAAAIRTAQSGEIKEMTALLDSAGTN